MYWQTEYILNPNNKCLFNISFNFLNLRTLLTLEQIDAPFITNSIYSLQTDYNWLSCEVQSYYSTNDAMRGSPILQVYETIQ